MARKRPPKKPAKRTLSSQALRDGLATAAFVFGAAAIAHLSKPAGELLGLSPAGAGLALVLALLVVLGFVCTWAGGALFNPANNAFLYAQGKGGLREHVLRTVAQGVGGVSGVLLARVLLPPAWTADLHVMAVGLRPGVAVIDGMACEFVLGALLAFAVLWSGTLESGALKTALPLLATVLAVKAGEHLTGPSLNPVFTFTFNFLYPTQSSSEHLLVYWVAPLAAGLFGGWAFMGWQQWAEQRQPSKQRTKAE